MRLRKFKIENLIPSSVAGYGLPYWIRPNTQYSEGDKFSGLPISAPIEGDKFSGLPISAPILVSDEVQGISGKSTGGFEIRELDKTSALGFAYVMPIGFKLNGTLHQLPWEPIMSIASKKTIVETPLAGNTRRGTVKEIINAEDYAITIIGSCYDHTHSGYPVEQVEVLKTLDDYCGNIEIISGLTDLFEIEKVVIKSLSLPAMQGKPYVQNFSMELVSDEDFLLVQN